MAERKAYSNDIIDLASAVSGLLIQKPGGSAQKSNLAKAKAKNVKAQKKQKTKAETEDESEQDENPEETESVENALEEFEHVAEDEELNKADREAAGSSTDRKKKRKLSLPKAKAKVKCDKNETQPAVKAKAKAKSKAKASENGKAKASEDGNAKASEDGKTHKNPLDSFLGKEWTKFKDEKSASLKGKMRYHDMMKEIARQPFICH